MSTTLRLLDFDLKQIELNYTGIVRDCQNKAKGSKIKHHDSSCNQNINKIFAECERLSDVLKKITSGFKTRQKEIDSFCRDKIEFEQLLARFGTLSLSSFKAKEVELNHMENLLKKQEKDYNLKLANKDIEIEQMEAQVVNMEAQNKKLNAIIEKLQIEKLNRSQHGSTHIEKLQNKIEELKKKNAFLMVAAENQKNLLEKVGELQYNCDMLQLQLDISQREKALVLDNMTMSFQEETLVQVEEYSNEEPLVINEDPLFDIENLTIKEKLKLILKILNQDSEEPPKFVPEGYQGVPHFCNKKTELGYLLNSVYFPILPTFENADCDLLFDTLLVEILTLQKLLFSPLSPLDKTILQGLLTRLFKQISGEAQNFDDQITNFYVRILKEITVKPVIAGCLNLKVESEIGRITEGVMESIMEYEAYCEIQDSKMLERSQYQLVLDKFSKKIDKRKNPQKAQQQGDQEQETFG